MWTYVYEVAAIGLISPRGGDTLAPGDTCTIRWQTFNPPRCDSISLFLRTDTSWRLDTIAHGLGPGETAYSWVVPDIRSDSCRIVAMAYGPGHQYDENETAFSIGPREGADEHKPQVLETKLLAAAPNPLSGKMTVRFQLRDKSLVRLGIRDVAGRLVAMLADGTVGAGQFDRVWDASRMPQGVYFLSFDASTCHETRKLILAR
jgi:hypothetical protein